MASVLDRCASTAGILAPAAEMLRRAGIATAGLDVEVMLAQACGVSRAAILSGAIAPDGAQMERFRAALARRAAREPVAYILGHREFYSLEFEVTPGVLIPRPETETLVDAALEFVTQRPRARVLDSGAGSGAIAIAIAVNAPRVSVTGVDISPQAIEVARRNAVRNGCTDRVEFASADLFPAGSGKFDLVVSNPPYIPDLAIDALDPEVGFYEPRCALDGGADGLSFYRRIAAEARGYLARDGAVMVEVGAGQACEVEGMFRAAGFGKIDAMRDLAGIERVVRAFLLPAPPERGLG